MEEFDRYRLIVLRRMVMYGGRFLRMVMDGGRVVVFLRMWVGLVIGSCEREEGSCEREEGCCEREEGCCEKEGYCGKEGCCGKEEGY